MDSSAFQNQMEVWELLILKKHNKKNKVDSRNKQVHKKEASLFYSFKEALLSSEVFPGCKLHHPHSVQPIPAAPQVCNNTYLSLQKQTVQLLLYR